MYCKSLTELKNGMRQRGIDINLDALRHFLPGDKVREISKEFSGLTVKGYECNGKHTRLFCESEHTGCFGLFELESLVKVSRNEKIRLPKNSNFYKITKELCKSIPRSEMPSIGGFYQGDQVVLKSTGEVSTIVAIAAGVLLACQKGPSDPEMLVCPDNLVHADLGGQQPG